jgi:hypothetical protein
LAIRIQAVKLSLAALIVRAYEGSLESLLSDRNRNKRAALRSRKR